MIDINELQTEVNRYVEFLKKNAGPKEEYYATSDFIARCELDAFVKWLADLKSIPHCPKCNCPTVEIEYRVRLEGEQKDCYGRSDYTYETAKGRLCENCRNIWAM